MVAHTDHFNPDVIQRIYHSYQHRHWALYLYFLLKQIMNLIVDAHPLLNLTAFVTTFGQPIKEIQTPDSILNLLNLDVQSPFDYTADVKPKVRDLLRQGGYKPTGRGKPASEYLRQAVEKNRLSPINVPVDICNVVSLHSGLPISVVDLDQLSEPMRTGLAPNDSQYVFNATGQTIKIDGLLCLFDAEGPCANAVKDSQRTKTSGDTTNTLSIIWGTQDLPGRTEQTAKWYHELLGAIDATTAQVTLVR